MKANVRTVAATSEATCTYNIYRSPIDLSTQHSHTPTQSCLQTVMHSLQSSLHHPYIAQTIAIPFSFFLLCLLYSTVCTIYPQRVEFSMIFTTFVLSLLYRRVCSLSINCIYKRLKYRYNI